MQKFFIRISLLSAFFLSVVIHVPSTFAQSFSDVPSDHFAYQAIEFLKINGIVSGYDDGTFKPEKGVNRAEAVKIIVGPLVTADELKESVGDIAFDDVGGDAWYLPYLDKARRKFQFVDGPPKKPSFFGGNPVIKVEFLKMLLIANGVDSNAYSEIRLPLSRDITNPEEWYYPYMRYALSSSMTMISEDGYLSPAKELTRGEVAVLMHRFLMYKEGRRTQALLSETESEILNVLRMMDEGQIEQAQFASARALIAARGALTIKPDDSLVKGALKVAEGFRALMRAYQAGVEGKMNDVITIAGDAWHLADLAQGFNAGLKTISVQMQDMAKNMANEARDLLAKIEQQ